MNCKDIKEALHAYCDGEASSLEKKTIEEHLASCVECQNEVAKIKDYSSLLKIKSVQTVSEGFTKETLAMIKQKAEYRQAEEDEGIPVDFVFSSMFFFARGLWRGVSFLKYLPHPAYSFRRRRLYLSW